MDERVEPDQPDTEVDDAAQRRLDALQQKPGQKEAEQEIQAQAAEEAEAKAREEHGEAEPDTAEE